MNKVTLNKEENKTKETKNNKTNDEKEVKESKTMTKEKSTSTKNLINKMNIYEKMQAITYEMGVVAKNLVISTPSRQYKAVSETDVLKAVKELENKYRIYSYPVSRSTEPIENLPGKIAMRILTVYRFVNMDKPAEYVDMISYGDGIDTLDKAPGKAMTYADKYALMKAYKISTGDDPDQEASPDPGKKTTVAAKPAALITAEQIKKISSMITEERKANMLKVYKKEKLEDLRESDAKQIIRKLEKEQKEKEEAENNSEKPKED